MTIVGMLIVALAPVITGLFSDDAEVLATGSTCLRILGLGFPVYAIGMILTQALNGAGDTMRPTFINFVCFWLMQIPLAYWLATQYELGPNGVFIACVASETLLTIMSVVVFRRGRWKTQKA